MGTISWSSQARHSQRLLLISLMVLAVVVIGRFIGQQTAGDRRTARSPMALSAEAMVAQWRESVANNPDNPHSYAQLGLALLQQVRETGDASPYNQAEMALNEALERDPRHVDALVGQGILALARHDFEGGLRWAEQARTLNPYRAQVLGLIVDAQVELGRYDEAWKSGQAMVSLRPDLASYSRISYLRELYGDTAGAIEAMQMAVRSGVPTAEGTLWARVQLGHLYFNSGDLEMADETYRHALFFSPVYPYAQAGMARVVAARGQHELAVGLYGEVARRLPLPEFVIPLGELYAVTGRTADAERQFGLVRAMQQLNAAAGIDVDLELALFEAEHGADPAAALAMARAAYGRRPSIYAADVLAWALYRNGRYGEAWRYSQEALRLGTRDARLNYHAGMIAHALDDGASARQLLAAALAINPSFSVRYGPQAGQLLATLEP